LQGTIICESDGAAVSFSVERNAGAVMNPTAPEPEPTEVYYIGNVNSHVLHSPSCGNLPNEKNRIVFETFNEALKQGYSKHKACLH
jgi:hypothetical protein